MRFTKAIGAAVIVVAIGACRTTAARLEPPEGSPAHPRAEQAALPEVAASLMSESRRPAQEETGTSGASAYEHHGMSHGGRSPERGALHDH